MKFGQHRMEVCCRTGDGEFDQFVWHSDSQMEQSW